MFGTYVYLGHASGTFNSLTPAIAFVCLSLICLLNYNVSTLPSSFNYINQVCIFLRYFSFIYYYFNQLTNQPTS